MVNNNEIFTQLLARSEKKRNVYIPEKSRYLNSLVVGTKNSGKTYEVIPLMAKQDIENKECGATFIVGKKDMALFLYSMAKKVGRKVIILKPSISLVADELLWHESYNYDYVNDNVINYKEAIRKKYIVIIDMEYSKYKGRALRATAMLLLQLQLDMQEWADTLNRPHFVYIDDSQYYLPFIEVLLTNGEEYNVGTTLFIQSRSQLKQKDRNYTSLVDNNIRSIILLNGLSMADVEYYQKQFYEHNINTIINRKHGQIIYETVDSTNTRRNGVGELITIDNDLRCELYDKAIGLKKKLTKKKKRLEREESLDADKSSDVESKPIEIKPIDNTGIEVDLEIEITPKNEPKKELKKELKKDSNTINADNVKKTTLNKPVEEKRKVETKKTPKEIIADNFNKDTNKYLICDSDFDFDEEF